MLVGNDDKCKNIGKGTIQIKMHDGVIRTLFKVRHVPDLKKNLISLGTWENHECKYAGENGIMKISNGIQNLMKGIMTESLYVL